MKIHITGMAPRMVSRRARAKISFSSLLADALTSAGNEVVRDAEHHGDVDLVVVGVSSMLSPAATYTLVGLELLARAVEDEVPLLLLADDPKLSKTHDAAVSVRRDPDRLWSDFLRPKRVRASDGISRDRVMDAVDILGSDWWPPVLVPMHAWARVGSLSHRLRVQSPAIPLDPSPVLDMQLRTLGYQRAAHARMWMVETNYADEGLDAERTMWPSLQVKNDPAWSVVSSYGAAAGVFQGAVKKCPGWWTPTPQFAARAGTVFVTDLDEGLSIGGPYYHIVDDVEHRDDSSLRELAYQQQDHLRGESWDFATLISTLEDVTGQASSFARPDMSQTAS